MLSIFLPHADPASLPVRGTGQEVFSLGPTWPAADQRAVLNLRPGPTVLAFGSWPRAAPTPSRVLMPRACTEPSRPCCRGLSRTGFLGANEGICQQARPPWGLAPAHGASGGNHSLRGCSPTPRGSILDPRPPFLSRIPVLPSQPAPLMAQTEAGAQRESRGWGTWGDPAGRSWGPSLEAGSLGLRRTLLHHSGSLPREPQLQPQPPLGFGRQS